MSESYGMHLDTLQSLRELELRINSPPKKWRRSFLIFPSKLDEQEPSHRLLILNRHLLQALLFLGPHFTMKMRSDVLMYALVTQLPFEKQEMLSQRSLMSLKTSVQKMPSHLLCLFYVRLVGQHLSE